MIGLGCFATCAGSTGGGIKMIRVLLLLKQSQRELVRIVHPNIVNPVVIGDAVVPPRVLQSVLAYMMIYGATIIVADDAAAVLGARRRDRLHRGHRLRQQHRPRAGRGRAGGQLRRR